MHRSPCPPGETKREEPRALAKSSLVASVHPLNKPTLEIVAISALLWAAAGACSSSNANLNLAASADAATRTADASVTDASAGDVTSIPCPPTTRDPIRVELGVFDDLATGPSHVGAVVEIKDRANDALLASETVGKNGVAFSVPSGGRAVDAYLRISAPAEVPGYLPIRAAFQAGLPDRSPTDFVLTTTSTWSALASPLGRMIDPAKAIVEVVVADCSLRARGGATVSVSSGGRAFYEVRPRAYDTALTTTAPDVGRATVFGVSPGDITVRAKLDGRTASFAVLAVSGEVTHVVIHP